MTPFPLVPDGPFPGPTVTMETGRCLNARYRQAGCRRCADACPTRAITLVEGMPVLEAALCIRCGVCLSVCPTGVFTQPYPAEMVLATTLAHMPERAVALVCPLHPEPAMTRAPVEAVVRHERCLAALGSDRLLAMSREGERTLWLDDGLCAGCVYARAQHVIHRHVRAANALLVAFGREATVLLTTQDAERLWPSPQRRPLQEGRQTPYTRRALFGLFGEKARTLAAEAGLQGPVAADLPPDRRRLLSSLGRLCAATPPSAPTTVATTDLPLARMVIDSAACSGCGLCARVCPTQALTFVGPQATVRLRKDEVEPFALRFQATRCVACALCAQMCPDEAVRGQGLLTAADLDPQAVTPLITGELVACADCGARVARRPGDETPRCHVCRRRLSVASHPASAKLLASLPSALPPNGS